MFSDQQNFREQLVEDMRKAYDKDVFIPSIFTYFGKNYESWCCETIRSGKWGSDLEACLISLLYKIRVTIINTLFIKTCSIELINLVDNLIFTQDTNQLPTRNFEVIDSVTILHHRLLNIDSKDPYCFNHFGCRCLLLFFHQKNYKQISYWLLAELWAGKVIMCSYARGLWLFSRRIWE